MDDQTRQPVLQSSEQIAELLQNRGVSPTAQRMEIARVLLSRPQHLSADQILARVNRDCPLVSKATVYNTMKVFAQKGLVREVTVDRNRV
ncbi:MAG: transcriptional repressor, partial [Gammaproteobacteria bacterium]